LHNQYEISKEDQTSILDGLLKLNGGLRTSTGHASMGGQLRPTSRAYGAAAIARFDQWINQKYSDDLLTAAQDLLSAQIDSGAVSPAYDAPPVSKGEIHTTYLSIQAWRQSFERSADERWLSAISNSELYLRKEVAHWKTAPNDIQRVNYALLGLASAGVGSTEDVIENLKKFILSAQNDDGSWTEMTQKKHALTTGQSIYALRQVGMNDSDPAIKRGIAYLLSTQQKNGGWSDGGSEKAAAMWAVLGLVSTDLMSINLSGIKPSQHVEGIETMTIKVKDNEGVGIQKIEIFVDDVFAKKSCKLSTRFSWNTSGLSEGLHTIDFIATNIKGQTTKRRLSVYAGDHYLNGLGTRFTNGKTTISVRDIAPSKLDHNIEFQILESKDDIAGKVVFKKSMPGIQGALSMRWDGKNQKKKSIKGKEFIAKLLFRNKKGKVLQTISIPFVHENIAAQRKNYANLSGSINFEDGGVDMANAEVELLDDLGNVVQSVRSTRSGKYQFRNLKDGKKYRVRAKKKGFKSKEKKVRVQKGQPAAAADFDL